MMHSNQFISAAYPQVRNDNASWMLDNGAFQKKGFILDDWIKRITNLLPYLDTCIGVVTPDVVGDYKATLERFYLYRNTIKELGYPVAFVTQDGLTSRETPWDKFEVLFIGGSDKHKLGKEASLLIMEAKDRGKWVHVGRVNSYSRVLKFWMADSWDGTHLSFEPRAQTKIAQAVRIAKSRQEGIQRRLL